MRNDKKDLEWAIDFAESTFGYSFTKAEREELIGQGEKDKKNPTAFTAIMGIIISHTTKYGKPDKKRKLKALRSYIESKGLEADGATMLQLELFTEFNRMRTNLKLTFNDPVSEATAKRYAEFSNKKPPDYASEVVKDIVLKASNESLKTLGERFKSVTDGHLPNTKKGIIDYLDYKTKLFASDRQQFIQTDYKYYRKLYAEKLKNVKFGDNISKEQSIINERAVKQAVNSANRVNRFNMMKNHELSRLEYINAQKGIKKGRGIYTARAAADEDCKAHQGVVMTYEQFISITPVHVNCICTFEPIPDTMSDEKVLNNMMNDDGTIPLSADVYRMAGKSRYPKFENVGMRVENKYKFRYKASKSVKPPTSPPKSKFDNGKIKLEDLIGKTTPNGVKIKEISDHIIKRKYNRSVDISAMNEAITNPIHVFDVKIDKDGRSSQKLIGKKATVVANPKTGRLVTTYPTSTKVRKRYDKTN